MTECNPDNPSNDKPTRREMLRGAARLALAGGLAVVTALLLGRKNEPSSTSACPGGECARCAMLGRCNQPAASLWRQDNPRDSSSGGITPGQRLARGEGT